MKRSQLRRTPFNRPDPTRTRRRRSEMVTTRPRKGSRRALKAKLDTVFSLYIRLRDARCITCFSPDDLECSHYYGRSDPSVRYDPLNCHAQCKTCNGRHNWNREPYTRVMLRLYGEAGMAELDRKRREYVKLEDSDYEELIAKFEMLTKVLKEAA